MSRKYIKEAKRHAFAAINAAQPEKPSQQIWKIVDYLQRQGALLHTAYENLCNGYSPWHPGYWDESDDNRVEKLERSFLKNAQECGFAVTDDVNERRPGLWIRLQTDPRGWPVEIIHDGGRSVRLGGKS